MCVCACVFHMVLLLLAYSTNDRQQCNLHKQQTNPEDFEHDARTEETSTIAANNRRRRSGSSTAAATATASSTVTANGGSGATTAYAGSNSNSNGYWNSQTNGAGTGTDTRTSTSNGNIGSPANSGAVEAAVEATLSTLSSPTATPTTTPPLSEGMVQIEQVFEEFLMKMEVLSAQHQIQGQFGILGATKAKEWASPLTPPPPPPTLAVRQQRSSSRNDVEFRHVGSTPYAGAHFVDGTALEQHAMEAPVTVTGIEATATSTRHTYNNNLFCGQGAAAEDFVAGISISSSNSRNASESESAEVDAAAVNELTERLQEVLRAAKTRHLECSEVSLPWDLMPRIATQIIKTSELEPCGVRGCTIFIEFQDEPKSIRRIASLKMDPNTVSTFELYLTLKHDRSGWTSFLPQFLKNLTRSNTILISPEFSLIKHKLYSCE